MKSSKKNIDWILLIFLIIFTNQVMFSVKLLAIPLVYLLRPNFSFGFSKGRVPKFFIYIILLAFINWVLFIRDFSYPYIVAFIAGNLLWLFSFLSFHQIKLSVERYGFGTGFRTLKVFIVVHFLFCVGQLINVMLITGKLNPYVDLPFPYGMSTGDNIYGTFMQNSLYNVTVSTFLTLFFLYRRAYFYAFLASCCVIFVFSNFGSIVFTVIMLGLFLTGLLNKLLSGRVALIKRLAPPGNYVIYIPFFLVFMVFIYNTVSPPNAEYIVAKIKQKIFSIETKGKSYSVMIDDQRLDPAAFDRNTNEKVTELRKKEEQNKVYFSDYLKEKSGSGVAHKDLKREMTKLYILKLQGKSLAVLETMNYLKSSKKAMLFGAGTTRFSSHIAQKMSGHDSSRLFMNILPRYVSDEYELNHKLLIEERKKKDESYFSTANFPDSFYNQIFGEYGVLGALIFLVFYIGYFLKQFKYLSYSFWLFLVLIPFAHLSYIFDTMCIMPFFEWLILLDIERGKLQANE